MELIFKRANASLSGLPVLNGFKKFLQSVALSASKDSSKSHTSGCLLKLSIFCQLKTFDNSFAKIPLSNFSPFLFKCKGGSQREGFH